MNSSTFRANRFAFFLIATAGSALLCAHAGQFQITANNARKIAASAAFDGTNYLVAIRGDNLFTRANTNAQIAALGCNDLQWNCIDEACPPQIP